MAHFTSLTRAMVSNHFSTGCTDGSLLPWQSQSNQEVGLNRSAGEVCFQPLALPLILASSWLWTIIILINFLNFFVSRLFLLLLLVKYASYNWSVFHNMLLFYRIIEFIAKSNENLLFSDTMTTSIVPIVSNIDFWVWSFID